MEKRDCIFLLVPFWTSYRPFAHIVALGTTDIMPAMRCLSTLRSAQSRAPNWIADKLATPARSTEPGDFPSTTLDKMVHSIRNNTGGRQRGRELSTLERPVALAEK